jgi:signal transduction histidine kinase
MKKPFKVLVLSKDPDTLQFFENSLNTLKYDSIFAKDGEEAFGIFNHDSPDIVITEVQKASSEGFELLKKIKDINVVQEAIIIADLYDSEIVIKALREGVSDFLPQPISLDNLQMVLTRSILRINKNALFKDHVRNLENLVKEKTEELETTSKKLQKAYESLDILSRMKGELLAFISHELRTPLTNLSAYKLINTSALSSEETELIQIINEGYEWLDSLVEKAIGYFNLVSNVPSLKPQEINIFFLLNSILEQYKNKINEKHLASELDCNSGLTIVSDKDAVTKIIDIVIDNAVGFNVNDGKITIGTKIIDNRFYLKISDTGIGLTRELCEDIFLAFTSQNINYRSGGAGLNLPYAKNLVYYLGGDIYAESRGLNHGSSFIIELPVKFD